MHCWPEQISRGGTVLTLRTPTLTSARRYEDRAGAIAWPCRAFSFAEHVVARDADGKVAHPHLKMGDTMRFLGPDHADDACAMRAPRKRNGSNQCFGIALARKRAVDAHVARARSARAENINAPCDTGYGAYEYSCRDPERHVWNISDYLGEA